MVWRFLSILVVSVAGLTFFSMLQTQVSAADNDSHLITVYDRGEKKLFLSKDKTIGAALKDEGFNLDAHDTVEPAASQELVAKNYSVNIYRARPVVVVDGATRVKTVSPYQTAQQIAKDVGITVYDEDRTTLAPLQDFVNDGAGLQLTIIRAKVVTVDLYGSPTQLRTQAKTVGALLKEKKIILGEKGRVSVPESTPITEGMRFRIWREGKQTVTDHQAIPVSNQIVYDADRPIGYRAVEDPGVAGNRDVTYEIEVKDGVEISRVAIANIVTRNPTKQTTVIGINNDNGVGLTKSQGAHYWTDSKGVSHRETYYDLNMSGAMQSCGQGGYYTVRPDGAKVDADGYVIIAANLSLYPRCSIVETSLGPAKVYDTGGFVARYPTGYDLATDWSNPDGR